MHAGRSRHIHPPSDSHAFETMADDERQPNFRRPHDDESTQASPPETHKVHDKLF